MAKFNDYYGMEIPAWALEMGFEDWSWHNDAAAILKWQGRIGVSGRTGVSLWVAEEDPTLREMRHRYQVTVELDNESTLYLETDDDAEVRRFLTEPSVEFAKALADVDMAVAAEAASVIRCASEHCHQEVQPVPAGLDPSLCALCNAEAAEEKFEAERKAWARRHGIAQRMVTVTVASEDGEVLDQFEVRHWQDEDMGEDAEGVWSGAAEGLLTARIRRYVHDGQ